MPRTKLAKRISTTMDVARDVVTAACHRLRIEPTFANSVDGVEVLNDAGEKLATLRIMLDEDEGCALCVDVRYPLLHREIAVRRDQRHGVWQPITLSQ
jgi:hypothetical protein